MDFPHKWIQSFIRAPAFLHDRYNCTLNTIPANSHPPLSSLIDVAPPPQHCKYYNSLSSPVQLKLACFSRGLGVDGFGRVFAESN